MEDIEKLVKALREEFAPMVRELCADDKFDCDELCAGNIMTSECIIFQAANALKRLLAENERLRSNCYPRDGVEAIIRERDAYRAQLAESRRRERVAAEEMRQCIRMDATELMNTACAEGQAAMAPLVCSNQGTSFCRQTEEGIAAEEYDEAVCRRCHLDGGFSI